MALSKDEINFYNDQGYLLVEDVISENQHKEMLALVDGFFEKSKMIRENDNIFDLEDVNGGLIGGASLVANDFFDIVNSIS